MDSAAPFAELICRARTGDAAAMEDLVHQIEPELRRIVRVRLTDPRLRRGLDSGDVFQSVFVNFFVRFTGGQFDVASPEQLMKLLVTMARNKIIDRARTADTRRTTAAGDGQFESLPAAGATPSEVIARADLLRQVRVRMTDDERAIAELRAEGMSWQEVADATGGSADAARKKLGRAVDRVCRQLGLDEVECV